MNREQPHSAATEHVEVPDTMTYTPDEKQLARDKQAEQAPDNRRRKLFVMGGSALAATGLAVGGWLALGGDRGEAEPRPEPAASAPADVDTEDTTASPELPVVEPTELTVERYQDGDSLMRAWNDELNEWTMANANAQVAEGFDPREGTLEAYVDKVNQPTDEAFIDALFVDDWRERAQLREHVESFTEAHDVAVLLSVWSINSENPIDEEPYEVQDKVTETSTDSASDQQIVARYRYEREDNSDRNAANDRLTEPVDGVTGGAIFTWENVDGVWKIADIERELISGL